jgi:hypothetical protein
MQKGCPPMVRADACGGAWVSAARAGPAIPGKIRILGGGMKMYTGCT